VSACPQGIYTSIFDMTMLFARSAPSPALREKIFLIFVGRKNHNDLIGFLSISCADIRRGNRQIKTGAASHEKSKHYCQRRGYIRGESGRSREKVPGIFLTEFPREFRLSQRRWARREEPSMPYPFSNMLFALPAPLRHRER